MVIEFLHSLQTFELACIIVLVGVLISALILRVCGVNPGGILGTTFLILAASGSLVWALVLLAIAPCISWIYGRFLSRIYQGREPAFLMAGMSVLLATILGIALQHFGLLSHSSLSFPIGIILPAIIASAVRKQGLVETYRYFVVAIALATEVIIVIHGVGSWLGYDFMSLQRLADARPALELSLSSLFAVASVVTGYLAYRWFKVQAAGFIVLPMLAAVAVVSPLNFLLLLATAAVVYIVTSLLRRYSLVIGTSRYALVAVVSITLVWTITYFLLHTTDKFSPYLGTGLFAALCVSVLVNEHTLYGLKRTFPVFMVSLAVMAGIVVGGSFLVGAISHQPQEVYHYVIKRTDKPQK